ncbi:cell division ATP-binding protein FtsE [Patescibacteria group bacterium]|nr:cell division ATP-binding protein FtsE [Patescibacteria group bacterium]
MIRIDHVYKQYEDTLVLEDVCLSVKEKDFLSLVGPSGAGKSTLIRLLIAEEKPSAGSIFVRGYDITKLYKGDIPFYRRGIGVVFQDFKLLPQKTVYENVAFALEVCNRTNYIIRNRVPQILDMVGLSARADNLSHKLSAGEMQRVAIARALVNKPQLLIADEPTGNLDPENSWEIIQLLMKINELGTTVFLATHDREIVNKLKKRVVTIENGKVVRDQKKDGKYII